jgi:hypothetical protein
VDEGYRVPRVLQYCKNFLRKRKAWDEEGIFRLAGSSEEIQECIDYLNTQQEPTMKVRPASLAVGHTYRHQCD